MATQQIIIDFYAFDTFRFAEGSTTTILLDVSRIDNADVTAEDNRKILKILNEIGKWEYLIKAGFATLSELGITTNQQTTPRNNQKRIGAEYYEIGIVDVTANPFVKNVRFHIEAVERQRRQALDITPVFSTEEIENQITNIPKWIAFKKAIEIIREQM